MAILAIPVGHRNHELPHDFAGKGVLNVLVESYQSDFCRFRVMTLSPLHLVVNWPVFTICLHNCGIKYLLALHCDDVVGDDYLSLLSEYLTLYPCHFHGTPDACLRTAVLTS